MATALVGLGSNLGDRAAALERAIQLLKSEPQIRALAVSRFRQSKPVGGPEGQGEFLNAAARLETSLSPEELLAKLLAMEDQIGRVREERWGSRVIDLDLLLYDRVEMKTPALELPHPRMCYRRFVLEPAAEIAPEMVWPVNGWSVETLLSHMNESPKYLALYRSHQFDSRELLNKIQSTVDCRLLREPDIQLSFRAGNRLECNRDHLLRLAAGLDCREWPTNLIWTISDFWYDVESVYYDYEEVPAPETALAARETWREIRQGLKQPRLVIVLEDPVSWHNQIHTEDELVESPELARQYLDFMNRVRLLARRDQSSPTVFRHSDDANQVQREVLAAMQAME